METRYQTPEKEQYRKAVWTAIQEALGPACATTYAGLLPAREGDEIPHVLAAGFKEERLALINEKTGELANSWRNWRDQYPQIQHRYGVKVGKACERMHAEGIRLHALNLDFCKSYAAANVKDIERVARSGVLAPVFALGLTFFNGRDDGVAVQQLARLAESARPSLFKGSFPRNGRITAAAELIEHLFSQEFPARPVHFKVMAEGQYRTTSERTGKKTKSYMTWAVLRGASYYDEETIKHYLADVGKGKKFSEASMNGRMVCGDFGGRGQSGRLCCVPVGYGQRCHYHREKRKTRSPGAPRRRNSATFVWSAQK